MARMSNRHPQMPQGTEVAAFKTHEEASDAVEVLAENDFPLSAVTIVGSGLHLAEKIVGRLTPARVALTGATQGLTWGLMMAVFSILFYPQAAALIPVVLIVVGVLLGVVINTAAWAMNAKRGKFAAQSSLVASRYAILVTEMPDRAFNMLARVQGNLTAAPRRPVRREPEHATQATASPASSPTGSAWGRVTTAASEEEGSAGVPADRYSPPLTPEAGAAASEGAARKPTEYGSRADEQPRFGVRLSGKDKRAPEVESETPPEA